MQARARLAVRLDDRGRTAPVEMFGEAPLLMRVTDSGRCGLTVHLVGGAAAPLGGDRLSTDVDVGAGSTMTVRSVAASLAQPGRLGGSSMAEVVVHVAAGASLDWHPQPLVSVVGSEHVQRTTVSIADATASLRWVEEVVLGRHGEASGRLTLHQRVTVAGRPVVQHTVVFDPSRAGVGRHGRCRVAVTVLLGGPRWSGVTAAPVALVRPSVRAARLQLDDAYTMLVALGDDLDVVREGLEEVVCHVGEHSIDEPETCA